MSSGRPAPFSVLPFRTCSHPDCRRTSDTTGSSRGWRICSACTIVRYCTVGCGAADWPEHTFQCSQLQAIGIGEPGRATASRLRMIRDAAMMVSRLMSLNEWFRDFLAATSWVGYSMWGPGVLAVDLTRTGNEALSVMAAWLRTHAACKRSVVHMALVFAGNVAYVPAKDVAASFRSNSGLREMVADYDPEVEGACCFIVKSETVSTRKDCVGTTWDVARPMRPGAGGSMQKLMRRLGPDITVLAPELSPDATLTAADILASGSIRSNLLVRAAWLVMLQRILTKSPLMLTTGDRSDLHRMSRLFMTPDSVVILNAPRGRRPCASIQMSGLCMRTSPSK